MRLPDDAKKSVAYLGRNEGDQFISHGTGFLVSTGQSLGTYLVTARHVARGLEPDFTIRLNTRDGIYKDEPISLDGKDHRFYYPDDPQIDLALLPMAIPEWADHLPYPTAFIEHPALIADKDIGIGDVVQVVGLFKCHEGRERNVPFVHTGFLAMDEEGQQFPTTSGAVTGILVQMPSLDGCSGSPVFVRRSVPLDVVMDAPVKARAIGAAFLLGIWHGAWSGEPEKSLKENRQDLQQRVTSIKVPVGVGIVTRGRHLLDLLNKRDVRELRERSSRVELYVQLPTPENTVAWSMVPASTATTARFDERFFVSVATPADQE